MWTAVATMPAAAQGSGAAGGQGAGSQGSSQAGSSTGATAAPPSTIGEREASQSDRTSAQSKASDTQQFIEKAAIANMAEIQLGQLAQQHAQDQQVKQFAQMMVDDHTKALEQLKSVASSQNGQIPSALDSKHQKLYDKLSKLQGAEFDKAYMDAMVDGHKDVEKMLKDRAGKSASASDMSSHHGAASGSTAKAGSGSSTVGTSGSTSAPNDTSSTSSGNTSSSGASSTSPVGTSGASAGSTPSSPDEWAAMTLPKVRSHLEQAKSLEDQVKRAARASEPSNPSGPSTGAPTGAIPRPSPGAPGSGGSGGSGSGGSGSGGSGSGGSGSGGSGS